jgi:acetoin utilization deacetylase AcuC-like enzyme
MATEKELTKFHANDYVDFLKRVSPQNVQTYSKYLQKFNVGVEDCPVFDGLFDFCKMAAGCSLDGARKLNAQMCTTAISWFLNLISGISILISGIS